MKKNTLLFLFGIFCVALQAQTYLTENFDAGIPAAWTITDAGGATGDSWATGTVGGQTLNGSDVAFVNSDTNGNGTLMVETLTSPIFDTTGATNLILQFDQFYRNIGADTATIEVFDGAAWVAVLTQTATAGAFSNPDTQLIDLTTYSNANMQIRFVYDDGDSWAWYWLLDNVTVSNVSCSSPTGLTVDAITDSSAQITWSSGATAVAWDVAVQPQGTGVPTTGWTSETSPYTIMTLSSATAYEVYVRANCGADGDSDWQGPVNFTTLNMPPPAPTGVTCATGTSTDVFTADFGTTAGIAPTGWTGTTFTGGNGDWDIANANDNSFDTGPGITYDGSPGVHLEYEASGSATAIASAITPAIDLTTATDGAELAFYMHAYGGDMGTLNVNVGTSPTGPFANEFTWIGDLQTSDTQAWVHIGVDLSAYLGQVIYVEFSYGGAGTGFEGDMSLDQITVETCGSFCIAPTGLNVDMITDTTAEITWNSGGSAVAWDVAVQPQGTGIPTSGWTSETSPYTVMALSPSTPYEVYVRSDCGGIGQSVWAGPVNFTTENQPPPAPTGVTCTTGTSTDIFTADFGTTAGVAPAGWTGTTFSGGNGDWDITNVNGNSGGTGPNVTYDGNPGVHLEYEASGSSTAIASAITPAIDLTSALDGAELAFYMHAFGDDIGTLNVNVGTSPTGPFTTEYSWIGSLQANATDPWVHIGVDLSAYLGQVIYIEFSYGGAGTGFEGDMSLDQITVETCGSFCIAPNNITVSNIGGQSADISWVGVNGEPSWNYVVQPAGTGVPTAGTNVTTPNASETALSFETPYEVYVQAVCADGTTSIWAGPVNFSTTVQTDFTIDCSASALDFNYCYENNDNTVFTFTTTTGFPVSITFNQGTLETCCDDFDVLDTDGTPIEADVTGDVTGLTYTSTGDTLSLVFDTDGSASCDTGGFTPINATVICQTCIAPTVTFTPTGDCSANPDAPEFFVEVNITDFGSVSFVQVADDQGSPGQLPSGPGVLTFGPYPAGTDVVMEVSTEDINCIEYSDPLTVNCPIPPNECSMIYAGPDTTFDCDDNTVMLEASFQLTGQDTNVYEINALSSCPTPPVTGGTPTSLEIDDRWSDVVDMGFDFCFFGDTYNQLIVGANGGISFDISNADSPSGWSFNQPIPNNTNNTLATVNIFAAYHDINPQTCGDINYSLLGTAPNRQFIVNYDSVCQFSCTTQQATMQVILYEGSNNIDINVFEKPACAWNSGSAVIGVQNMAGDVAFAPAGRNTGNWSVDASAPESYRFSPGQSTTPSYIFEWYDDNGIYLGDTPMLTVNPTETSTYVASITYEQCAGPSITITDSVTVELTGTPSDTSFNLDPTCDGATATITGDAGGTFAFNPVPTDGAIIDPATGTITNAVGGTTYTVEYSIDPMDICGSTTVETVTVFDEVVIMQSNDLDACDDDNDGTSTFDLTTVEAQVLNGLTGVTVSYYETQADADAGIATDAIANPSAYDVSSMSANIYIRVEDNTTGCFATTILVLNNNMVPTVTVADINSYEVCPNATVPITITTNADNFNLADVTIEWDLDGSIISGEVDLNIDSVLDEGDYTITITDNVSGCFSTQTITVKELVSCVIPQGISPNGDGFNDRFDLSSYDVQSLKIYNRTGREVYVKTNGYRNEWFGQSKNGDDLPTGTYYYVMEYRQGEVKASYVYINR